MKVILWSTAETVTVNVDGGVFQARVWQGVSEAGAPCQALIAAIGAEAGHDTSEFDAVLLGTETPQIAPPEPPIKELPDAQAEAAKEALIALVGQPAIPLFVEPFPLFLMLSQLQLALRHPDMTGTAAVETRRIADTIAARLSADHPALLPLIEAGWNLDFDVPNERRPF